MRNKQSVVLKNLIFPLLDYIKFFLMHFILLFTFIFIILLHLILYTDNWQSTQRNSNRNNQVVFLWFEIKLYCINFQVHFFVFISCFVSNNIY